MRKRLLVLLMGLLMVVMSAAPALAAPAGKARTTDRHISDRACQTPAEERSPVIGILVECEVYPDQGPGRGFSG
jgi:hypothetical protein